MPLINKDNVNFLQPGESTIPANLNRPTDQYANEFEAALDRLRFDRDKLSFVEPTLSLRFDKGEMFIRRLDTAVRNSLKNYFDRTGTLVTAGIDEFLPSFDPGTGEPLGLSVEQQGTNILLWNRRLDDDSVWVTNFGIQLTRDQIGLDGVENTAWTVTDTDTDTGGLTRRRQTQSIPADNNFVVSSLYYLKTTNSSAFPGVVMRLNNDIFNQKTVNTDEGILTARNTGSVGTSFIEDAGRWWKITMVIQNDGTKTASTLEILPAVADPADPAQWLNSVTGSVVYDYGQMEINQKRTSSPILTEGSQVTRESDKPQRAIQDGDFNTSQGSVIVSLEERNESYSINTSLVEFHAGSTRIIRIARLFSGDLSIETAAGSVSFTSSEAPFGSLLIAISYTSEETIKASVNGSPVKTAATTATFDPVNLSFGAAGPLGERDPDFEVRYVEVFPYSMTDEQLQSESS